MGRTVPTYRSTMAQVLCEWKLFRKALRKHDREIFDLLVKKAMEHASAATFQGSSDPVEMIFLSILIEQEKEIRKLKKWKDGSSTSTPTQTGEQ